MISNHLSLNLWYHLFENEDFTRNRHDRWNVPICNLLAKSIVRINNTENKDLRCIRDIDSSKTLCSRRLSLTYTCLYNNSNSCRLTFYRRGVKFNSFRQIVSKCKKYAKQFYHFFNYLVSSLSWKKISWDTICVFTL